MNQEKIGKFIAQCRKEKNITQEELAEKLRVSNKSVSRWENGKNMPDYSILKDLCSILDIDVNELISGERLDNKEEKTRSIENLDLILKEYYKMKKVKNVFKIIAIACGGILVNTLMFLPIVLFLILGIEDQEVIKDTSRYESVIGIKAEGEYESKWGVSEEIFPSSIKDLDVEDFKMVYYDPWDKQFLSYLVVNYDEENYNKEVERLNKYGIENYKGIYGVTGFTKYKLLAMESDEYHGFVYAITDGESKIIYVEIIFCNYYMDINYKKEIPNEYLPDGFDATDNNKYQKEMRNKKTDF